MNSVRPHSQYINHVGRHVTAGATQNALRAATSDSAWEKTRYMMWEAWWRVTLNEGWEETRDAVRDATRWST